MGTIIIRACLDRIDTLEAEKADLIAQLDTVLLTREDIQGLLRPADSNHLPDSPDATCTWSRVARTHYVSECGRDVLLARTPQERGWHFCPHCGGALSVFEGSPDVG